jgi:hypothetical protein
VRSPSITTRFGRPIWPTAPFAAGQGREDAGTLETNRKNTTKIVIVETECGDRPCQTVCLLTRDEARRIAIKMNTLPKLLRRPQY